MAGRLCALLLAAAALVRAANHVVLVSIDGFAAYQLLDQELLVPNIRELIGQGAWFASSETVFPSVTHPSHTTIVTGVEPRLHGVVGNRLVNRRTGEDFHPTNKARKEVVRVPTLFDAAKAKGLTTAALFWPETRDDPAIDYNIPEVFGPDGRAEMSAVNAALLDELRTAGVPIDLYFRWYGTERQGAGDAVLAEAAAHLIEKRKPNLLAIHVLVTDKAQHEHGPHHYLARAAFTMADHCVAVLRRAVERAGIADRTTFILAADHGFHSVYHELNVHPAFAARDGKVRLHGSGWTIAVELTERFEKGADMPALDQAFGELRARGIRVAASEDMHGLGLPRFEESDYARGHYLLIPDIDTYLVADAKSAASDRRPRRAASHSHGYLPQHPRMYPMLVLSGAGVKRGLTLPHARNIDIAPTAARLLGFEMPKTSGRVLEEALLK
jgi:predicted AlkP superfamily pyrophosphatase or phosphodiesterase